MYHTPAHIKFVPIAVALASSSACELANMAASLESEVASIRERSAALNNARVLGTET
jgi:hypothetical protein